VGHRIVRGTSAVVRRGPTRDTVWFFFPVAELAMTAAGGSLFYGLNAAALALRPFTVIRSRFEFMVRSDQIAASETQAAAFGFCIVTDQARAAGVASIPTPITEMGSDVWFLHKLMFNRFSFITGSGFANVASSWSVDSRAMRKVAIGEDIVGVGEGEFTVGAGVTLTVGGRMLVKIA